MKYLIAIVFTVCAALTTVSAQQTNQRVFDEKSQTDILVGNITREGLMGCAFSTSYNEEYPAYKPNVDTLNLLKDKLKGVKCVIVMGTWCGDSKEQVPRFLKILDLTGSAFDDLKLIAVDREKKAPEMDVKGKYLIEKVPTFIFYRGDVEIGRIIESPKVSLEKDLLAILITK